MFAYSAMKNIANLKLEYSVWNPATSSDSASGRSKGTRLVSAMAAVKIAEKADDLRDQMFHFGMKCHQ